MFQKEELVNQQLSKISSYARINNISMFETAQQIIFKTNSKAKRRVI